MLPYKQTYPVRIRSKMLTQCIHYQRQWLGIRSNRHNFVVSCLHILSAIFSSIEISDSSYIMGRFYTVIQNFVMNIKVFSYDKSYCRYGPLTLTNSIIYFCSMTTRGDSLAKLRIRLFIHDLIDFGCCAQSDLDPDKKGRIRNNSTYWHRL